MPVSESLFSELMSLGVTGDQKLFIYLVQYLACDRNDEEYTEDDDLKEIEAVASLLQSATEEEKAILIALSKELGFKNWANQIGIE